MYIVYYIVILQGISVDISYQICLLILDCPYICICTFFLYLPIYAPPLSVSLF